MIFLNKGRVETALTVKINGLYQLKKLNLKSIYNFPLPKIKMFVYHYLHQKHISLVPKIDNVLILDFNHFRDQMKYCEIVAE